MNYPLFDFDKVECQEYVDNLSSTNEKIKYYKYLLLEYMYEPIQDKEIREQAAIDPESYFEEPDEDEINRYMEYDRCEDVDHFIDWCNRKINYYEKLFEIEQIGDKMSEKSNEKINNPTEPNTKIQWNGTEGQLIYLIKALKENNFLPQNQNDEPYVFIEKYFVNKQGKPFKHKQLSQTKYQYEISKSGKPKKSKIIDEIIDETKSKTKNIDTY